MDRSRFSTHKRLAFLLAGVLLVLVGILGGWRPTPSCRCAPSPPPTSPSTATPPGRSSSLCSPPGTGRSPRPGSQSSPSPSGSWSWTRESTPAWPPPTGSPPAGRGGTPSPRRTPPSGSLQAATLDSDGPDNAPASGTLSLSFTLEGGGQAQSYQCRLPFDYLSSAA